MVTLKQNKNYGVTAGGDVILLTKFGGCKRNSPFMKTYSWGDGYRTVHLWNPKDKKYEQRYVHQLVLESFTPKPSRKHEPDHINGNKSDKEFFGMRPLQKPFHSVVIGGNKVRDCEACPNKELCFGESLPHQEIYEAPDGEQFQLCHT